MDALIAAWTDRLRDLKPEAVAILLKGSHARGEAGPHSDIDFDVLLDGESEEAYPVWFDPDTTGHLRHVSVAVEDLDGWLAGEREPEPWAFGLPVREPARLLWAATPELIRRLDRSWRTHPPAEPELEDWFSCLGKMRNALDRGDHLGLRQAAQALAGYTPTLLRPLNPVVWAGSPREALDIALGFPIAPERYREDMLACLGLAVRPVSPAELFDVARRLVAGTLALLRERFDNIAPLLADDLAGYLRDGTLDRYVRQLSW